MAELPEIDNVLTSPAAFARLEHYEALRRLRAEDPVHWTVGNAVRPFWSVTRHADCVRILMDAETFSSDLGGIMPPTAVEPTPEERITYGFGSLPTHMDPPRHLQIRRPFNKHFAVPTIQRLQQSVEDAVEAILDNVTPRGECDLVEDVAAQLPVHLIFAMMGVPEEDKPRIRHYCMAFGGAQDPAYQVDGSEAKTIQVMVKSLFDYMFDLAMRRREEPRNDFTTVVGTLEVDGVKLSDRDVGWWCLSFVLAGLETTRNALSGGFFELMRRQDQAARLRADPALMPLAAEEIVRFVSPSKHKFRIATRDCEIGGQPIRKGDWVVGWLVSANRDEAVFSGPDAFDVGRNPNPHLAYSVGEHSCLGRHLARLEIRSMVPAVLARLPDMEVSGDLQWLASNNHTGLRKLPVRFTPSPARRGN
jgi:cytochrome P450